MVFFLTMIKRHVTDLAQGYSEKFTTIFICFLAVDKIAQLTGQPKKQLVQSAELEQKIREDLKGLGFEQ